MISAESFAGQSKLSGVQRTLTLLNARTGIPDNAASLTTSWLTVASCVACPDNPHVAVPSSADVLQRELKVAAIKRRIQEGTFHVATDTLARKLMRAAFLG